MGNPLDLVSLTRLMERSRDRPEVFIGLIDGLVAADHADLTGATIWEISRRNGRCDQAKSGPDNPCECSCENGKPYCKCSLPGGTLGVCES